MQLGIPKEAKLHEYRVGGTPEMVCALVEAGHQVLVETGAGLGIGITDDEYIAAGAQVVESVWDAELIVKVKEPQASEYPLLKEGQLLFCYLHLASCRELTKALLDAKVEAIALEMVTDDHGKLPLLHPMSQVAGRVAVQVGALGLLKQFGGKGLLLSGILGGEPARVTVIGGGSVGTAAAQMAVDLGAHVTVLDLSVQRVAELEEICTARLSTPETIEEEVLRSDFVVGAVLVPGLKAPKVVSESLVKQMSPGSVIVDVAIDQGGCCATSRPTTHADPFYIHDGVVHYCVTNMPGACPLTSTRALTHETLPYVLRLANDPKKALSDPHFAAGLSTSAGRLLDPALVSELNL